jgi:electron transfer flavoprotein alpha subunit
MTVLCLIEQADDGGVADVSLRALTFARALAVSLASAASPTPAASAAPISAAQPDQAGSSMYQKVASDPSNGTFTPGGEGGEAAGPGERSAGPGGEAAGPGGVAAVVVGDAAGAVPALSEYGVGDAFAVELAGYAPQAWARALAGLAAEVGAAAVVAAGTDHGSEVMAHLGAITGLPMAANCVSATRSAAGELQIVRQRWAGSLLEDAVLDGSPALMTVAADAVTAAAASDPAATAVHVYQPALDQADLRVRATESAERSAGMSLATARVVVGGGRGVGGPDGFGVLEELAGLLGGVVGVSRVVTSEGWRPHKQQVGQTGTRISPELYLACGISGAIQHMAGCLSAKHIVAVNTDPDAPIISHADYAVIGDLNQVLPALVAAIRAREGSS